ncbi:NAD-dependent epimerase/dehydratase family protein, partial [Salmonella enterica subsp. enterica serovar Adelaide]|nr:NAD-dependent epimerase/dehydratase family protein [Salmonella enterica]EEF7625386.1 NAD-dependent epimerase/dehydratase family protein [Salmonella enterica subsp. enterica serovar Adelaide]
MKVLLTGSSGMVGKNILEHASAKDYEILTPTSSDLNLLVIDEIEKFMLANKPECIIHAAGLVGGIHANINRPFDFLANNLLMGLNLVTIAKKLGIKKFLNLGSSCMYPRNFEEAIPEKALLTGELEETNEGYAIAKVAVAKACEYISRENSNYYYKTIIPCNLYGKYDKFGDDSSHMIPAVIKKIHHAKANNIPEIEIWGDGNSRREFMYAEDLADL